MQEQLAAEQEVLYGSKPATKKPLGQSNTMVGTPTGRRMGTPMGRHGISSKERGESGRLSNITPINYVALAKDDSISRGT